MFLGISRRLGRTGKYRGFVGSSVHLLQWVVYAVVAVYVIHAVLHRVVP